MERRGRKLRAQSSPERTKIWMEPNSKNHSNLNLIQSSKRVPVVYYLSKNRHLEHPHFIEVPISSAEGLHLRDVINRLNVLRGKGMASMYSWSCKRSYKNGFVWHDLSEDDLVLPAQGNEYILKGSELLDKSPSDRSNSTNSKTETLKTDRNPKMHDSPKSHQASSSSSSPKEEREAKPVPVRDEEQFRTGTGFGTGTSTPGASSSGASSSGASSPILTEYKVNKPIVVAQDAWTQTDERKTRQRSNPNSSSNPSYSPRVPYHNSSPRVPYHNSSPRISNPNFSSSPNSSPRVPNPNSSSNPSSSSNPNSSPRVPYPNSPPIRFSPVSNPNSSPLQFSPVSNPTFPPVQSPNFSPRIPTNPNFPPPVPTNPNSSPRVPPNPNSSIASSSSTGTEIDTLDSLIRAEASRQISQIRVPKSPKTLTPTEQQETLKPSNLLLQLLTCNCNRGFGLVPNYRPRFTQLGFPSPVPAFGTGTNKGVIRGLDRLNESSRTELGFMVEEVFENGLKRPSYEQERPHKPTIDSKCLPQKTKKISCKIETVKSPPQGPNFNNNLSPQGPNCNNKLSPVGSSKGASKRTVLTDDSSLIVGSNSMRLESFNKERIFKIEES